MVICEKTLDYYDGALEYINSHKDAQAAKLGTKPGEVKLLTNMEEAVRDAWMVIEAVSEKLDLKISIMGQLDKLAPPACVIATNSSSLRSDQMLAETKRNYRICNGHYYMPPDQLYAESMSCGETDPDIFPFVMEKAAFAGFISVHAKKPSTGLAFNRIWAGIKRECLLTMADGVTDAKTIDAMFNSWFNAEKSPCEMMDAVGLDTVYDIEVVYEQQLGENLRAKEWLKTAYVDKGFLVKKTGKGLIDNGA